MPHLIIEYSSNLRDAIKPERFVETVHAAAMNTGAFPEMSLRTRASEQVCYRVGDGHPQNGFVHVALRIRLGRERIAKYELGQQIFAVIEDYLEPVFRTRPLGLTFEIQEVDSDFRFLRNNMTEYWAERSGAESGRPPLHSA